MAGDAKPWAQLRPPADGRGNVVRLAEQKHYAEWPGLDSRLRLAVWVAGLYHWAAYGSGVTVTSIATGPHVANSKHFVNKAVDLRAKDKSTEQQQDFLSFLAGLAIIIGGRVILEDPGTTNVHYHWQLA